MTIVKVILDEKMNKRIEIMRASWGLRTKGDAIAKIISEYSGYVDL